MSGRAIATAAGVLAIGYAMTLGLFWALLNVPESSVAALGLSVLVVILVAVAAGLTTAGAAALLGGASWRDVGRRAMPGLLGFLGGLVIFAGLWWMTGAADRWWSAHTGEVDAIFIRYVGTARTGLLHRGVFETTWLVRWALGLSAVAGLAVACAIGGLGAAGRGLRAAVNVVPLLVTAIAAVIVGEGVSRLIYWRPAAVPATWLEPAFVTIKLAVLYLLVIWIAAIVLAIFQRAISLHALPARS